MGTERLIPQTPIPETRAQKDNPLVAKPVREDKSIKASSTDHISEFLFFI